MKIITILSVITLSACASTQPNHNVVTHELLGQDFISEKNTVCEHFEKSNDTLVLREKYLAKYLVNNEVVEKWSQFEVSKKNLPAWHCGQTAWVIQHDLSKEVAVGRDVPLKATQKR